VTGALAGGATAEPAQGPVKDKFGAWGYRCDKQPGEATEQCALTQQVNAEDRGNSAIGVIIMRPKGAKVGIMRVIAPLSVFLLNGVGLKIDQTDIGRNAFFRCFPSGCLADAAIDDKLLDQLTKGKIATIVTYMTPYDGMRHQVKLEGLREGYDKLR
jgi:invasion protein IalB